MAHLISSEFNLVHYHLPFTVLLIRRLRNFESRVEEQDANDEIIALEFLDRSVDLRRTRALFALVRNRSALLDRQ